MTVRIMSKPVLIAAAATTVLAGVGTYVWQDQNRPPLLEIYVFSLKNSQSVFIRTPNDKRILIDGGSSEVVRAITRILPFYSRRIDTIIATAATAKNTLGLIEVVNRYGVNRVYVPGITLEALELSSTTDRIYETFLNAAMRKQIPIHPVKSGNSIRLDPNVSAKVLFPATGDQFKYSKASPPEMILRIVHGSKSILLLGDVSKKVQKFVAEDELESDVLVVSNNGANLSAELLEAMRPNFLVYSQPLSRQSVTLPAYGESKDLIPNENKFNTKEAVVKIISDGHRIDVSNLDL